MSVESVRFIWPTIVQALARPEEDARGGVFGKHGAQQAQALQKAAVRL
jgi:hypothetical protein